jgi:hypothetical protein
MRTRPHDGPVRIRRRGRRACRRWTAAQADGAEQRRLVAGCGLGMGGAMAIDRNRMRNEIDMRVWSPHEINAIDNCWRDYLYHLLYPTWLLL